MSRAESHRDAHAQTLTLLKEAERQRDEAQRERDEALAALKDEMKWDMGGVPENEYKARVRVLEEALREVREFSSQLRVKSQNADTMGWVADYGVADRLDAALAAVPNPVEKRND